MYVDSRYGLARLWRWTSTWFTAAKRIVCVQRRQGADLLASRPFGFCGSPSETNGVVQGLWACDVLSFRWHYGIITGAAFAR